jgi:RNA polymerase sigma-70 factor (ECF subfamily)
MVDWDAIVSRDGPTVWRTVYRIVGNRADAEDCFQETFLSALAFEQHQEQIHNPRALLQRLATARALDRLRRRYRRTRHENAAASREEPSATDSNPDQAAEASELSEKIRLALSTLPPKQAQAFCLFNFDGWDYSRIARHLDLSVGGVGTLLHRARQRLQILLAAEALPERSSVEK